MHVLTLLLLAATPVSLQLELSEATRARVGLRVQEVVAQRLEEEGFALEPRAPVKLRVEELHGTIRLSATVGAQVTESVLKPSGVEWRDELALELAQRLCVLAHEAAAWPPQPTRAEPPPPAPDPPPQQLTEEPALPEAAPPPRPDAQVGAGVRGGVTVRPPAVDATFAVFGFLRAGTLQPLASASFTLAVGPGLTVSEVPLLIGLRAPISLGDYALIPEVLGGARLHFFSASSTDVGGARVDVLASVGVTFTRALGPLKLGARLGLDIGSPREHLLGAQVLWSRGAFAFGAQLHLER